LRRVQPAIEAVRVVYVAGLVTIVLVCIILICIPGVANNAHTETALVAVGSGAMGVLTTLMSRYWGNGNGR